MSVNDDELIESIKSLNSECDICKKNEKAKSKQIAAFPLAKS